MGVVIERINPSALTYWQRPEYHHAQHLRRSIKLHGVKIPLFVYEEGDDLLVLDGNRRLLTANIFKRKDVPIIKLSGDKVELRCMLQVGSRTKTPLEISKVLHETKLDPKLLAKACNRKLDWIEHRLAIADMPVEVKSALHKGTIPEGQLGALLRSKTPHGQLSLGLRIVGKLSAAKSTKAYCRPLKEVQEMLSKVDGDAALALVWASQGLSDEDFLRRLGE